MISTLHCTVYLAFLFFLLRELRNFWNVGSIKFFFFKLKRDMKKEKKWRKILKSCHISNNQWVWFILCIINFEPSIYIYIYHFIYILGSYIPWINRPISPNKAANFLQLPAEAYFKDDIHSPLATCLATGRLHAAHHATASKRALLTGPELLHCCCKLLPPLQRTRRETMRAPSIHPSALMAESGLLPGSYFSLGITGLNVNQLLTAEAESSTTRQLPVEVAEREEGSRRSRVLTPVPSQRCEHSLLAC